MPYVYQLPTYPEHGGRKTQGFLSPVEDKSIQHASILPRRVLPIIFLPGIMGTHLRLKPERQRAMGKDNNIAWRPDNKMFAVGFANADSPTRQLQLDPDMTEVDTYDPVHNPTGDPKETADMRHDNVSLPKFKLNVGIETPLICDDPPTAKPRQTKEHKARKRGWGEVYFDSYRHLLERCEQRLNSAFWGGQLDKWWKCVVGVAPTAWQATEKPALAPLTEEELKQAVKGCWFPVHAVGYNWLQSNWKAGEYVAQRIEKIMADYRQWGFQCEKVIVVTHSMGGLVGRALVHPKIGKMQDKVLGIVHGVQPAIGAATGYKRMRCGFEDPGLGVTTFETSMSAKVCGNMGAEVTAVLANSPGGLQLLPSEAYGNGWLRVMHKGRTLRSLPQTGDPYEEIYKLQDRWYGLIRPEWINPAKLPKAGLTRTHEFLDQAKAFHRTIEQTYHDQSYAHYGADNGRPTWRNVTWEINERATVGNVDALRIVTDTQQGALEVADATAQRIRVRLLPADGPGDQTVPLYSADHQLRSGKFKGLFRQTGYEHQASYKDEHALCSTLYSLVRIAQTMQWSTQ
ncbi:esterase/lipase family protein [Ralstonia pseudosolanacearum]|uniref:esterase/lipase family protein n=1 Tax=Ralstonia pseudosolanacearum TaxID=1310165 RepID=UPI0007D81CAB|nr:hypothetical protein [Ralstonia pseudosolanacearum]MCD9230582.1 GPI inositol-deacylase [Ralstonia pseudosolanacearum]MDC6292700.1 hypothetical protein [Ralstonia pseudosolanacearum]MDD7787770.1 hypothetical protein [Ralstonia pseudosolanacearum]MDN3369746.1 hypothetical protein [Ralstonia pseudosolanacearum]OAK89662.1 hypothetical protein AB851_18960 [Ralstonia pseudosolanacearum]